MSDVTQLLELASEIDRQAKYYRVAVQYGKDTEADRAFIVATESAVRKIRAHVGADGD